MAIESKGINPSPEPAQATAPSKSPAVDQMTQKTHDVVDTVAENISQTEAALRERALKAEGQLRELGASAQKKAEANTDQVKTYISENPLASAGIAFAAGIVASALLRK